MKEQLAVTAPELTEPPPHGIAPAYLSPPDILAPHLPECCMLWCTIRGRYLNHLAELFDHWRRTVDEWSVHTANLTAVRYPEMTSPTPSMHDPEQDLPVIHMLQPA